MCSTKTYIKIQALVKDSVSAVFTEEQSAGRALGVTCTCDCGQSCSNGTLWTSSYDEHTHITTVQILAGHSLVRISCPGLNHRTQRCPNKIYIAGR